MHFTYWQNSSSIQVLRIWAKFGQQRKWKGRKKSHSGWNITAKGRTGP